MGKFEPGHAPLPGAGRPKGSVNKDTATIREMVKDIYNKTIPERLLEIAFKNPIKEAEILLALLPYTYAKLAPKEDAETLEARAKSDAALVANAVSILQTKVRENPDDTER